MTAAWHVDRIQSHLMGQALRGLSIPIEVHPAGASRELAIWTELVFVAICHQTNWYRLHDAICLLAVSDPEKISPKTLARLDVPEFLATFGPGIDSERPKLKDRVELLRDLGMKLQDWPAIAVAPWVSTTQVLLAGYEGLYSWLKQLQAFGQDPLAKKARVLVHQLLRFGLIAVSDTAQLAPAVDYHITRYYVRTGRVLPLGDMANRLLPDQPARVEFHTHLRIAVEEAMFYTAAGAEMRIDALNHFEWQIARSFCTRRMARCECGPEAEKPLDAPLKLLYDALGTCPMIKDCRGARDINLRSLVDPRSAKPYY